MANVHKDQEGEVLLALVDQHRESHRPVATLIVQAALNASSARDRAMVVVLLAGLKRQQLIEQHGDAWTNCHHLAHSICCDLFRLELALRDGQGGAV